MLVLADAGLAPGVFFSVGWSTDPGAALTDNRGVKSIATIALLLLCAVSAFAAETSLHGTYSGTIEDLRVRFSDAMTLYFKRYDGHVDADGVGHASYGHDSVTVTLEVKDDRHYTLTVTAPNHETKYTAKWADALRARL